MSLEVNIRKAFPDFVLDVEFTAANEAVALLGSSGCGKSLTLKCIAGIEKPDIGRIVINGQVVFDSDTKTNLPPQKRNVGFLFQNYALFPTMTVLNNIACVVEGGKANRMAVAQEMVAKLGLDKVKNLYPREISGGQQQRCALARILVKNPEILMLDEPFSALDSHLRWQMEQEMTTLLADFKGTTLFVSHDRDEAYRISSKIAIISGGQVDCIGDKDDIFNDPKTLEAALMTGCKNISKAEKTGEYSVRALDWDVELQTATAVPDAVKHIGIRSNHFELRDQQINTFSPNIVRIINEPFHKIILFNFDCSTTSHAPLQARLPKEFNAQNNPTLTLHIPPERIICLV